MRRQFFLTLMFILGSVVSFAQSKFEFVDKSGNVIPNHTVYEASGKFEDWGGFYDKHSGVFIKGDGNVTLRAEITKSLEEVDVMFCAGGACRMLLPGDPIDVNLNVPYNQLVETALQVSYTDNVSGTTNVELTLKEGDTVYSKITVVFTVSANGNTENEKFKFVDANGDIIYDGINYNASGKLEDWGGLYDKHSGVFIKGEGNVTLRAEVIKQQEGIDLMFCPNNICNVITQGEPSEVELSVTDGKLKDIVLMASYGYDVAGTTKVKLTLKDDKNIYSKITVIFTISAPKSTEFLDGNNTKIENNALFTANGNLEENKGLLQKNSGLFIKNNQKSDIKIPVTLLLSNAADNTSVIFNADNCNQTLTVGEEYTREITLKANEKTSIETICKYDHYTPNGSIANLCLYVNKGTTRENKVNIKFINDYIENTDNIGFVDNKGENLSNDSTYIAEESSFKDGLYTVSEKLYIRNDADFDRDVEVVLYSDDILKGTDLYCDADDVTEHLSAKKEIRIKTVVKAKSIKELNLRWCYTDKYLGTSNLSARLSYKDVILHSVNFVFSNFKTADLSNFYFIDGNGNKMENNSLAVCNNTPVKTNTGYVTESEFYIRNGFNSDNNVKLVLEPKNCTERTVLKYKLNDEVKTMTMGTKYEESFKLIGNTNQKFETLWEFEDGVIGESEIDASLYVDTCLVSKITLQFSNKDSEIFDDFNFTDADGAAIKDGDDIKVSTIIEECENGYKKSYAVMIRNNYNYDADVRLVLKALEASNESKLCTVINDSLYELSLNDSISSMVMVKGKQNTKINTFWAFNTPQISSGRLNMIIYRGSKAVSSIILNFSNKDDFKDFAFTDMNGDVINEDTVRVNEKNMEAVFGGYQVNSNICIKNNYKYKADVKLLLLPKHITENTLLQINNNGEKTELKAGETYEKVIRINGESIKNINLFWIFEKNALGNAEIELKLLRGSEVLSSKNIVFSNEESEIFDNFKFTDKEGNVIEDKSVVESNEEEEEIFGGFMINSGVYVQNNYNSKADVTVRITPKEISNNTVIVYFVGEEEVVLNVNETTAHTLGIESNSIQNIPLFWKYEDDVYGKAEVLIELLRGSKLISSMTLKFTKEDTGITGVINDDAECNIYDITGKLVKVHVNKKAVYGMEKGIYIIHELSGNRSINKVTVR